VHLTRRAQVLPPTEVLRGAYLFYRFDPALIQQVINALHPNNMMYDDTMNERPRINQVTHYSVLCFRVQVVSKKFQGKVSKVEEWFETEYEHQPIPQELLKVSYIICATLYLLL
jgi:hypothetical protein